MEKEKELIPGQETGGQSNTESSATLSSEKEAKDFYQVVRKRLLKVNEWNTIAGAATADFALVDEKGNVVQRDPQKGDYFSIDIPGPKTKTGEGTDWVRIEAMEENNEEGTDIIAIRVRPASNPNNNDKDIAHFFDEHSTSSFIVKREGNKVTASVHGRNEKPNTDTEKLSDKVRNAVVATGAIGGFSKIQWKSLVNGLVKEE